MWRGLKHTATRFRELASIQNAANIESEKQLKTLLAIRLLGLFFFFDNRLELRGQLAAGTLELRR